MIARTPFTYSFLLIVALKCLSAHASLIPSVEIHHRKEVTDKDIRVRIPYSDSQVRLKGGSVPLSVVAIQDSSAIPMQSNQFLMECLKLPRNGIEVRSESQLVGLAGDFYFGKLRIFPGKKCEVVNILPLERYLEGVVNKEFRSDWPRASVEAQVIAARTYALIKMDEARKKAFLHYDVEASERDQVYGGLSSVDEKAKEHVRNTKGKVLLKSGKLFPVFYHSTCGGFTESAKSFWGVRGSDSAPCGFCSQAPHFNWSHQLTPDELRAKLTPLIQEKWPNFQPLKQTLVSVKLRNLSAQSPRVKEFDLEFEGPDEVTRKVTISAYRARTLLGYTQLKSTWFQLRLTSNGRLEFYGKGSGHGVGLCQWGAKEMGERGFSTQMILSRYFPDSQIASSL